MKKILLMLLLSTPLLMKAQPFFSNNGYFTADNRVGCAPFTVNLTDISGSINVSFFYGEDPNETGTGNTSYTYTEPGVYNIVIVVTGLTPSTDTLQVEVLEPVMPLLDIALCSGNQLSLTPGDDFYDFYQVSITDGTSTFNLPNTGTQVRQIQGGPGTYFVSYEGIIVNSANNCPVVTDTLVTVDQLTTPVMNDLYVTSDSSLQFSFDIQENTNYQLFRSTNQTVNFNLREQLFNSDNNYLEQDLNTMDNYYCYFISAFDRCQDSLYSSDTLCSIALDVSYGGGSHDIEYQSGFAGNMYTVEKNNVGIFNSTSRRAFVQDLEIACNREEFYHAYYMNNQGVGSYSDTLSLVGLETTEGAVTFFRASFQGDQLLVNWSFEGAAIENYVLRRSIDSSEFRIIQNSTDTFFVDLNTRITDFEYCYSLQYEDSCGNRSGEFGPVCPVRLIGSSENDFQTLNWTPYIGFNDGPYSYSLVRSNNDGTTESLLVGSDTTAYSEFFKNPLVQSTTYFILVYNELGELISQSNSYTIFTEPVITFATGFSPNGDGINDEWAFQSLHVARVEISIYNRWGNLVARLDDLDSTWDGRDIDGNLLPSGNYVYVCNTFDTIGKKRSFNGGITLIR